MLMLLLDLILLNFLKVVINVSIMFYSHSRNIFLFLSNSMSKTYHVPLAHMK